MPANQDNQYLGVFNITPKVILVDAHSQYQSSVLGNDLAEKFNAEVHYISSSAKTKIEKLGGKITLIK